MIPAIKSIIASFILIIFCQNAQANWTGPKEIVVGSWGHKPGQFAIKYGDTMDTFPMTIDISSSGRIAISEDQILERVQIFDSTGQLKLIINTFAWTIAFTSQNELFVTGAGLRKYDASGKLVCSTTGTSYNSLYTSNNGDVIGYDKDNKQYSFFSSTCQTVKTSTSRPLELGSWSGASKVGNDYKHMVVYPDKTYEFLLPSEYLSEYQAVTNGDLVVAADSFTMTYRINSCGKITGRLKIPKADGTDMGKPMIAPNGDIYAWKRLPEKYSIVKWRWIDVNASPKDVCSEKSDKRQ